jgi:predicted AlkP superfamily phosphohydrolase/phosphomutase
MAKPRLVVIALDAADRRLVGRMAAEGHLPTLQRFFNSGFVATILTPPAVLEGGIWPTLLTSTSVATHGMMSFQAMRPGTYEIENPMYADRLPSPPFWAHMSRAGKRVAVIDVPFARPLHGLNGIQLTNWGVHDSWSWPRSSWPQGLMDDVVARFGEHPILHCDAENRSLKDYEDLRAGLIAGVRRKTALLRDFLVQEEWDFFFGAFSESHCAGHQFWHLTDPAHPRHDRAAPASLRSAIRDTYRAIDDGLGAILGELGPGVPVLVLLSHGMGPYYSGSHLLDAVLERLGFGAPPAAPDLPGHDSYANRGLRGVAWSLRHALPRGLRQALRRRVPRPLTALWNFTHPVPNLWKPGMRAWSVPSNNMTSAIRINVKGRERFGTVAPGAEYETVCEQLIAKMLELENPETGQPAVQWVRRTRDLYQGPRLEMLPDLLVEWEHHAPINALRSVAIGTVAGSLAAARTGDHHAGGLLLGRGPHFRPAAVEGIRTQDLAPTLLGLVGVPIPAAYEGRSIAAELTAPAGPRIPAQASAE